jgi:hypothetical protein
LCTRFGRALPASFTNQQLNFTARTKNHVSHRAFFGTMNQLEEQMT